MFQRVFPSLGRILAGKRQPPAAIEERRVWVRHPCRTATTVHNASDPQSMPVSAWARNVSRGGVMLVVRRRIEAGELVSIELAGDGESRGAVLACVLQAEAAAEGEWVLNCSFAAELSLEDLQLFDVASPRAVEAEQRSLIRYSCRATAAYEVLGGSLAERGSAGVLNVSIGGIGLLTAHPICVGTLLSLQLRHVSERLVATMLASVVTARPAPEDRTILGCNFLGELSQEQLADFV